MCMDSENDCSAGTRLSSDSVSIPTRSQLEFSETFRLNDTPKAIPTVDLGLEAVLVDDNEVGNPSRVLRMW